MKKHTALFKSVVFITIFAMIAAASSCAVVKDPVTVAEAASNVSGELMDEYSFPYLVDTDGASNAIQEYGTSEIMSDIDNGRFIYIEFPLGSSQIANDDIKNWARSVRSEFVRNASDGGDFSVSYNSYMVNGRYAGVKELGASYINSKGGLSELAYVQNIDLEDGRLLTNEDIFTEKGELKVIDLLKEQVAGISPEALPNIGWLKYTVLTGSGIQIVLPRGEFLPSSIQTQVIEIPYTELGGAFRIDVIDPIYGVSAIETNSIDPDKPMVALTFDDGPSDATLKILDLFQEYGGHGTFCVVGNRLDQWGDTLKRTIDEGHEIATHTWDHTNLTKLSQGDAERAMGSVCDKVKDMSGYEIKWLRPPYGSVNDTVRAAARQEGLAIAYWEIDTLDWKTKDPDSTFAAVKKDIKDGSIILCHDLYNATASAMEKVIPYLVSEGYQLVTLSEMLYYKQGGAETGKVYYHGRP